MAGPEYNLERICTYQLLFAFNSLRVPIEEHEECLEAVSHGRGMGSDFIPDTIAEFNDLLFDSSDHNALK